MKINQSYLILTDEELMQRIETLFKKCLDQRFGDETITTNELQNITKLSKNTLCGYAREGKIKATKAGKNWIFKRSDVEEWLSKK